MFKVSIQTNGNVIDQIRPRVYTRAKDSGFITKPKRFGIGFIHAFTHTATNPVENHLGCRTYPKTLNPGKKVETLYPETFESREKSRVNGFP
jgi:hypothetical protein